MQWKYKEKKKNEWERFFAFFPKPIGKHPLQDGQMIIWFQWMERKWLDSREGSNRYKYRLPQSKV